MVRVVGKEGALGGGGVKFGAAAWMSRTRNVCTYISYELVISILPLAASQGGLVATTPPSSFGAPHENTIYLIK